MKCIKKLHVQVGDLAAKQTYPLHQETRITQIPSVYVSPESDLNCWKFPQSQGIVLGNEATGKTYNTLRR